MAILKGPISNGTANVPFPTFAGIVAVATYSHTFTTAPAAGDIVELAVLPQDCKPVEAVFTCDDMDAGAALLFDLGIMTGETGSLDPARACGSEFFSGLTLGQAGGVARPTKASAYRIPLNGRERGIGLKVATAAANFQPGTVTLTISYTAP